MKQSEIDEKIAKLEKAINSPATPEAQKTQFKTIIEKLKAASADKPIEPVAKKTTKKSSSKKRPAKKETAPSKEKTPLTLSTPKKDPYDCEDLLAEEKARQRKAKEAAKARAEAPKYTPATKNKLAIEKLGERLSANITKRIEKGEVKRPEVERLIKETEKVLHNLKASLKKL